VRVSLRPSTAGEWELAHDVTRDNMARYYHLQGREWDTNTFRDSWPTTVNFTLEISGEVVGFLRLTQLASSVKVRDIQVVAGQKGRGIGSFALEAAERFTREHGLETIQLDVFETNPAIRLYERLGFRRVKESDGVISLEKRAA
jgi:ribosomal protein S18 acetylase RimI-like enzyme